jgi:hypothetical protein
MTTPIPNDPWSLNPSDREREELAELLWGDRRFDKHGRPVAPPPVVEQAGPSSWEFHFREGETVRLCNRKDFDPPHLFAMTVMASLELDGQAVRCGGFVPSIALRINHCRLPAGAVFDYYIEDLWAQIEPQFTKWHQEMHWSPKLVMEATADFSATFGRESQITLKYGVMQIEMTDGEDDGKDHP